MKKLILFFRLIHINFVLAKYGLDKLILSIHLFSPLRFLIYLNPSNWYKRHQHYTRGIAIRKALEELGPLFVKFGQALSVRRDLLPEDIADALVYLQDRVPPFSGEIAKKKVEKVLAMPMDELFINFETTPLASASIAQVHAACLKDGKRVVVKIRRPGIKQAVERDIQLLKVLANLAERYWLESRRFRPKAVVEEFEKTLINELDFTHEAANASQLRRNFVNSTLLYVPEVYWPYTREKLLVLERIEGIPISDINTLKSKKVNIKRLAEIGVEIFFTQVFRDCFFHADMHPGNIFVAYTDPNDPYYVAVDFGIMGSLSPNDQRYLAENFLAFFNQDYRRVACLHVESGWVPPDTRIEEFEAAMRVVCEPIFERPLKDISVAQILLRLFQTGRRFKMEIQPQLVLLQKTLFAVEGLGRQLYPELDLWATAKPYLESWLKSQIGLKALFKKLQNHTPYLAEQLIELPGLLYDNLKYLKYERIKKCQNETNNNHSKENDIIRSKLFYFLLGVIMAVGVMGIYSKVWQVL